MHTFEDLSKSCSIISTYVLDFAVMLFGRWAGEGANCTGKDDH